ncbi:hypothetical protein FM038_009655 [Shewanella eurypsychrophilus]|uniref:DUF4321 domain-containing protein n=1 Tax=Shewanella eurypsychrophilus TaxID=2593656 RepID=A0ABX6V749_9GAMM|nr:MULTISPECIES: hypothetical protein [Shewanella]QFU22392.1 hypothetical protein FS418_11235 [Shewanella sp. YLB-09]QPG57679.1 hypothetical protein FM038_009655 [Shewanella eurypsychrophilus]
MKPTNLKKLSKQFWGFGLLVGALGASLITSVITLWELIENPGEIFRNAQGVNWSFVFDTASSWFIPSFLYLALISAIAHLSISALTRGLNKSSQGKNKTKAD